MRANLQAVFALLNDPGLNDGLARGRARAKVRALIDQDAKATPTPPALDAEEREQLSKWADEIEDGMVGGKGYGMCLAVTHDELDCSRQPAAERCANCKAKEHAAFLRRLASHQPESGNGEGSGEEGGKWFAPNEEGRLEELRDGDEAGADAVYLHPAAALGRSEDWDPAHQLVQRIARLPRDQQEALAEGPSSADWGCQVCNVLRWPGYASGGYGPGWENHEDANWLLNWHGVDPVRCGAIYGAALALSQLAASEVPDSQQGTVTIFEGGEYREFRHAMDHLWLMVEAANPGQTLVIERHHIDRDGKYFTVTTKVQVRQSPEPSDCARCKGSGVELRQGNGEWIGDPCPDCDGTGHRLPDPQQEGRGERQEVAIQARIDRAAERIAREHNLYDADGRPDGTALAMARAALDLQGEEG